MYICTMYMYVLICVSKNILYKKFVCVRMYVYRHMYV